MMFCKPIFQLG